MTNTRLFNCSRCGQRIRMNRSGGFVQTVDRLGHLMTWEVCGRCFATAERMMMGGGETSLARLEKPLHGQIQKV